MSTTASSYRETRNWSASSAFPKLHSRARETETDACAGVTITKSLARTEIPQCIFDSCDGLGLFSQDPIGFAGGDANLYRYVGNGPTNATDPSGLQDPVRRKLPSEFPFDVNDETRDDSLSLSWKLYWQGFSSAQSTMSYNYGCGALASFRIGSVYPDGSFRLMFPSRNEDSDIHDGPGGKVGPAAKIYWFTSYLEASQAADELVKQGKQVRIIVFQTTRKPREATGEFSKVFESEIDPNRIQTGAHNFMTMHWDGCRYNFEYINDGHSDDYRLVSGGNTPRQMHKSQTWNYFGVVVITPEMRKSSKGLPRVPWED